MNKNIPLGLCAVFAFLISFVSFFLPEWPRLIAVIVDILLFSIFIVGYIRRGE
jgi:hypothetical protein